jgi:hypothetical protein
MLSLFRICFVILFALLISCSEQSNPNNSDNQNKFPFGNPPSGDNNFGLRIVKLIPNPSGDDNYRERFTVKNFFKETVSLNGYKVVDLPDSEWELQSESGQDSLKGGDSLQFISKYPARFLNSGATVELRSPSGLIIQVFSYTNAIDGDVFRPQ